MKMAYFNASLLPVCILIKRLTVNCDSPSSTGRIFDIHPRSASYDLQTQTVDCSTFGKRIFASYKESNGSPVRVLFCK